MIGLKEKSRSRGKETIEKALSKYKQIHHKTGEYHCEKILGHFHFFNAEAAFMPTAITKKNEITFQDSLKLIAEICDQAPEKIITGFVFQFEFTCSFTMPRRRFTEKEKIIQGQQKVHFLLFP